MSNSESKMTNCEGNIKSAVNRT